MLAALLALALSATPPSAQLGPEEAARFKALFNQGEKLYAEGDVGAAIWNFKQADALRPTPEVAYDLGKAYQKLGDEPFTAYYYRLYLRRSPNAADALELAELLGDMLEKAEKSGRGFLEVEGSEDAVVTISGKRFEELPVALFLPPGDYDLAAQFKGSLVHRNVSIRTGKTTTVSLSPQQPQPVLLRADLSTPPGAEPAPAPVAATQDLGVTQTTPSTARRNVHVGSIVGGAVGLTALVAGVALGSMSSADAARYQRERSNLTLPEAKALANSANGKATAGNFLMIGGGALAVAAGVTFFFTLPEPGAK